MMINKVLISSIIILTGFVGNSAAQWVSDSAKNTVVCNASNIQQNPQACTDGSNGIIVVWEDYRSGTNFDIYAQKLNVDGIAQWTANGVNLCTSTANQTVPIICSDGSGGAYVVWKDTRTGPNGTDLYAQHISSDGSLNYGATGSGVAIAGDASPPDNITICSDGSGNAFVAWEDSRTSTTSSSRPDIWMNKLSSGSVSWGGGGRSVISQSLHQTQPKIVDDGNGGCYLVWVNSTLPASIWGQRLNSGGGSYWTSPGIQIFGGTTGSSDASRSPSVSRDGSQLCLTWEQLNSSNSTKGWNLLGNRINSNGSFVWGNSTVAPEISTDWSSDQINSLVFSDDSSASGTTGLMVVYEDLSSGSRGVVLTRLLYDGASFRPAFPNHIFSICRQANNQSGPVAVKTGSGELLVAWNDTRSYGGSSTYSAIYSQRVDKSPKRFLGTSPANSTWGQAVSKTVNKNADQVVLVPRASGGIAAWRDDRNGNTDIYAQLIFRDGSLPVDLSSFTLREGAEHDVLLNWQTASEKDNAGFEIERRLISDPQASIQFETVGSYLGESALRGAGSSNVIRSYSYIDKPGKNGVYEYRLTDLAFDGEKTSHAPKTIEVSSAAGAELYSVGPNSPNPFSEKTVIPISLAKAAIVECTLIDVFGRTIATPINSIFQSGTHSITLDPTKFGNALSSGAYYYTITIRDPETNSIIWKMPKAQLMIRITN
ncbi:MAG: hypothetical protein ABI778_07435 [Ignavibacteriota bacterium]